MQGVRRGFAAVQLHGWSDKLPEKTPQVIIKEGIRECEGKMLFFLLDDDGYQIHKATVWMDDKGYVWSQQTGKEPTSYGHRHEDTDAYDIAIAQTIDTII